MFTAYVVVGALLTAYLTFSATVEFARIRPVLTAMAKTDVPQSWLPMLASLKAAGALGLLVGIAVPLIGLTAGIQTTAAVIGTAAAVGVILFFVGAVLAHLRARDISVVAFAPATVVLLLAVATLVLGLASV
jgi:DoxX-like family